MTDMKDQEILIRYRLKQAHSSLKEAVFLRENSDTTLGAVNRAYYAMFYAVLALLQKIEKVPRKHSGAIALFDSEFRELGTGSWGRVLIYWTGVGDAGVGDGY